MSDRTYVIGLGNPGESYHLSRHNAGFLALDGIARAHGFPDFRMDKYFRSEISKGRISSKDVWLVKPQTFMNLSGDAVGLLKKEGLIATNVVVIYDDVDLPIGHLRVRDRGRSGTHNGMKSLISHLGTEQFNRLRIGIRASHPIANLADFVLGKFSKPELEILAQVIDHSNQALEMILQGSLAAAQAKFNQKT